MEEVKECDGDAKKEGLAFSISSVSDDSCDNAVRTLVSVQSTVVDKILAFAVQKFNSKNWKKIAEYVPDRTDVQCLHRWQKVLNPDLVKGPWTKEEDDLIVELVGKQGNKKWSEIAKSLPGRIGKQCRERWHNHLNPDINKSAWTKEEELALIKAHEIYGNKWAEIAKFLHGRTENSIKNHWNCSVKKRVDLYLARGSGLYNYQRKAASGNFEAANQSLGMTFSLDHKMDFKSSVDTCNLDLALGNANIKGNHLQPFTGGNCRFLREEDNDLMKPPFGTLFDKKEATACALNGEQWKCSANNAKMPGDSHHITTNQSFPDHFPTTWNIPFNVIGSDRRNSIPAHELVHPVNGNILPESCRRPQDNVCPVNCLGITERSEDAGTPQKLENINFSFLCYEHPRTEDLSNIFENGRFPSAVSYYTPPSHDDRGVLVSCSSPESILRSAARSFKSTPSIIRKRVLQSCRQTGTTNHSAGICTPEEKTDKSSNSLHLAQLYPCDKYDLNIGLLPNAKQLFLSPPKSQKLETSTATNKSIEKRLEHAFDAECDSTNLEQSQL
ncbi:hypothetical protein L1049_018134 [Liquidambar formosana]|uniref:Uncharacterized protein n=1 Tax=Liquidambar formosana TaxID=63359 RepID=A0AAP0NIA1_LIQFO